jgi:hypothetical protein
MANLKKSKSFYSLWFRQDNKENLLPFCVCGRGVARPGRTNGTIIVRGDFILGKVGVAAHFTNSIAKSFFGPMIN